LQEKKIEKNIWGKSHRCHFGIGFGTRFAVPAILAAGRRGLPFWQFASSAVLAIANRPVWVVQPPVVGGRVVTPLTGG